MTGLRGRELYSLPFEGKQQPGGELLRRAIQFDAGFVPAVFFLRATHSRLHKRVERFAVAIPRGSTGAARLALALEDQYPPGPFYARGVQSVGPTHDAAIREIETAISLNPNYAEAHNELG